MEPKMEQELAVEDMDEPKNNYNELYPCPNDKLCAMFKCYMESQAKLRLGQCIKLKGKQLYPLWIKKTIKLFQQYKCNKCTGSHQHLICGGYASYIANLTNAFSDIDVFIHCNKRMDEGTLNFTSYKIKTNRTVSTIRSKLDNTKPNVQFIQVKFDIGVSKEMQQTETFRDLMAMYVVSKFDLPVCRVAIKPSLSPKLRMAYIINAAAFDVHILPISEERKQKYEARKIKAAISPPPLQVTTLFNLINKYC